jgi:hypothetical protein
MPVVITKTKHIFQRLTQHIFQRFVPSIVALGAALVKVQQLQNCSLLFERPSTTGVG